MMKDPEGNIVEIVEAKARRGWFGPGAARVEMPAPEPGSELFVRAGGSGADGLVRKAPAPAAGERTVLPDDALLARVRTAPRPVELSFAAALKDENGHGWDLTLRGAGKGGT